MTVIEIRKRGPFYEDTLDLLNNKFDKKNRGRDFFINRFERSKSERIGYSLQIDSQIIGFIGLIESNNMIGLSTWFVIEKYRKYSMSFLSKVMNIIKDKKIVNSSPNPIALKIFKKLYNFNLNNEFIGLPKKILGLPKSSSLKINFGEKINVCYGDNISLFTVLFFIFKYKKICVALTDDKNKLFLAKKINVLFKNVKYFFPLSVYGDIYD